MTDAEQLKKKIEEWTKRLDDANAPHSIAGQAFDMLDRSAFYRAVNESRRHLPGAGDGKPRGNGTLHALLHTGYLTMHASAVRRLTDRAAYTGPKGVNSLYNLVIDIRKERCLLTRENILEARGHPYAYEAARDRAMESASDKAAAAGKTAGYVSLDGWFQSEYWHETWDTLCEVEAANRSACDAPSEAPFDALLKRLTAHAKDIGTHASKYIAHAASPESLKCLKPEQRGLALIDLWEAERDIMCVASYVGRCFGSGSFACNVPTPQFELFEYLDEPFATPAGVDAMDAAWREHDRAIQECACWNWTDAPP